MRTGSDEQGGKYAKLRNNVGPDDVMTNPDRTEDGGAHGGDSRRSGSAAGEGASGSMTVPLSQVQNFLSTLQNYSASCAESRRVVEESGIEVGQTLNDARKVLDEARKVSTDATKSSKKVLTEVKKLKQEMADIAAKQRQEFDEVRRLVEQLEERTDNMGKKCGEVRRALERIEAKKTMVCSFEDMIKESERLTRRSYTRSLYAGRVCREIGTAALQTLEATIRIFQAVASKIGHRCSDEDDRMDTAKDGVSENSGSSTLSALVSAVLFKTRYLRKDVQTVDRAAELMEDVRLLDNSLRVVTGELKRGYLDSNDLNDQRRRTEALGRISMEYDENKHGTRARFDELVTAETERRMEAAWLNGSTLVSAVVSILKFARSDQPWACSSINGRRRGQGRAVNICTTHRRLSYCCVLCGDRCGSALDNVGAYCVHW